MPSPRSLFERLDAKADDTPDIGRGNDALKLSIQRNIAKLLNTRAGAAPTPEAYGLSDFNDVAREHPDLPGVVARDVADLIARYEPRLEEVHVIPVRDRDDPTVLEFSITGRIRRSTGVSHNERFDLSLARGPRADVR
jgi:type VI secretion system protein